MECSNCRKDTPVKEIKKNTIVTCINCGCMMKCLDINEHISRWKVMNPFDIEDKRNS